jgi:exonuclease III
MKLRAIGCLVLAIYLLHCRAALAEEYHVATWNIAGAERDATAVAESIRDMAGDVGQIDILIIEEVISQEQVSAAAEALGFDHWVISDFAPPPNITNTPFASLEVAVISRFPIERAGEWDTTGQGPNGDNFPPRTSSALTLSEELEITIGLNSQPSRGFLRADIENGPSVYAVHWKSSRGESCNSDDIGFAVQREDQARGLVEDAEKQLLKGRSLIIGGDFNIQAPGKALRVGTTALEDCLPTGSCAGVCGPGGKDGYDDSLAILTSLSGARILSEDLEATFIDFATSSGAIDHLIVAGNGASAFEAATAPVVTSNVYFGSDHRPVVAVHTGQDVDSETRIRELMVEIQDRLQQIEQLLRQ